jgi:hypothetical protein
MAPKIASLLLFPSSALTVSGSTGMISAKKRKMIIFNSHSTFHSTPKVE